MAFSTSRGASTAMTDPASAVARIHETTASIPMAQPASITVPVSSMQTTPDSFATRRSVPSPQARSTPR